MPLCYSKETVFLEENCEWINSELPFLTFIQQKFIKTLPDWIVLKFSVKQINSNLSSFFKLETRHLQQLYASYNSFIPVITVSCQVN